MPKAARLRLALAQIDTTVGDIEGNARLISAWIGKARAAGASLVVFPELAVTGYPPEDLLLRRSFLEAAASALERIAAESRDIVTIVGFPELDGAVHNAAAVLAGGQVAATYRKVLLPNYGVFDEKRYFEPGTEPALIECNGVAVGLTICEDVWYGGPPATAEAEAGACLIVNCSASPYHRGKGLARERMVAERSREIGAVFALCNLAGGQDELVFDGHSVVTDPDGATLARGRQFEQDLILCDLELEAGTLRAGAALKLGQFEVPSPEERNAKQSLAPVLEPLAEVYAALELGLRDYVDKNGFERVLVAVSGGIDSALVALLAADALGPERLVCVVMPSPHSSDETQADARAIAGNLGAELIEIPIQEAMATYASMLPAVAGGDLETGTGGPARGPDLADENLQARIRGNLMMALSNRAGWLVLTTGNKSEMSVGYATLYGDMAGGFAVIKDVPKTLVYELVRYRNEREGAEPVPAAVIERPPSAELRPDQLDSDSLPPYEVLDRILQGYVEEDLGREELLAGGMPAEVVDEVLTMVDRSEYKRRQAPPGIKITPKAFGRDRRLPITNRYAE